MWSLFWMVIGWNFFRWTLKIWSLVVLVFIESLLFHVLVVILIDRTLSQIGVQHHSTIMYILIGILPKYFLTITLFLCSIASWNSDSAWALTMMWLWSLAAIRWSSSSSSIIITTNWSILLELSLLRYIWCSRLLMLQYLIRWLLWKYFYLSICGLLTRILCMALSFRSCFQVSLVGWLLTTLLGLVTLWSFLLTLRANKFIAFKIRDSCLKLKEWNIV